ncbi:type II toxin-antitoxin system Phd/YefM family antitoxin [Cyanobium sp. Morenito 9A2]|uniref:type II toxin-antitoxin system Phd/YefM family antitoxin n=1 Tax=Cyanobium sp. Morenito 9A2 TaxID=2823718 RepID=UPI0020CD1620|nr:type II toxin-antitoxin system prevent-host-death family antitoxin [Cyanobium sp. Morenito 9A2]MCP9848807.1 type II toxin-antitoxin system Phd/YefM family antitoxin [Cyanobium sp. Morenito 9A2]
MAPPAQPSPKQGGLRQVNVHEAKTQLSRLLQEVEAGQAVVIARAGVPIAQLVPLHRIAPGVAPPGAMRGEITMADDFDRPLDDLFTVLQTPMAP